MKTLATETSECFKTLGPERGQAFIGLIADFRAALFLAEVPGGPSSVKQLDKVFELNWPITEDCDLLTTTEEINEADAWKGSYRIKLNGIDTGGSKII